MKTRCLPGILPSAISLNLAAQGYPAKPVRMVAPWPPDGTNDILGRALAVTLSADMQKLARLVKAAGVQPQ